MIGSNLARAGGRWNDGRLSKVTRRHPDQTPGPPPTAIASLWQEHNVS